MVELKCTCKKRKKRKRKKRKREQENYTVRMTDEKTKNDEIPATNQEIARLNI